MVYKKDHYFRVHRDGGYETENNQNPDYLNRRKVSIVIFLNAQSTIEDKKGFGGGALTLYGLAEGNLWKDYGFPLNGEAGLLIAFRSDTYHEVETITHGARYTIISWFF